MSEPEKPTPKTAKATIYIDVEDEITSIIDKMENAGQKVVALVLPKRASTLQSIVNMRLLKRSADNADKNVVLITAEDALLPLAGAAGLHVADSLSSKPYIPAAPAGLEPPAAKASKLPAEEVPEKPAETAEAEEEEDLPTKIDYKKSIGELASVHEVEHPETIELGDEENPLEAAAAETEKLPAAPKDKKLKVPNFDKFRLRLGAAIAGFVALIVFIYLALAVLPGATIAIQTTSTPVSASLSLNTSDTAKAIDEKNNIIPAVLKSSDQTGTQQVAATGQQNNGTKASGSVVMRTSDCSGLLPSGVSAGTGVSSAGLTFITQSNATFSPTTDSGGHCYYTSGSVNVQSQSGGTKYNLPSGTTFTVSGHSTISASNSSAFSGGTDNIQTVVSQSDVDNAVAKLKGSSSTNFSANFQNQLGQQGYYVLSSTLKQADPATTASPDVGQQASNTTVTIKITYSVLCVKKDDLTKMITDALLKQVDATKEKVDATDVLKGATVSVASQTSATVAVLSVTENTSAVPIIDQATLKKQAVGKKSADIISQISDLPGVKNVNVSFHPFWVSKAPKASKIKITLQHVTDKSSGQ